MDSPEQLLKKIADIALTIRGELARRERNVKYIDLLAAEIRVKVALALGTLAMEKRKAL